MGVELAKRKEKEKEKVAVKAEMEKRYPDMEITVVENPDAKN